MIKLHKINGNEFIINAELIEMVEGGKDTLICLATGNRYMVQESADEVAQKVVEYRKKVNVETPVANPTRGFERS